MLKLTMLRSKNPQKIGKIHNSSQKPIRADSFSEVIKSVVGKFELNDEAKLLSRKGKASYKEIYYELLDKKYKK